MKIKFNGEDKTIADGLTISMLLDDLNIKKVGIAVEVNREIVPKTTHDKVLVNEGDVIEIVRMVGGG
ncbi:MAG: sulfur carrier protein ThiS [Deltaproteobacteria bacterium]|nr:sulfur carrier protein ThiS [Deltaproteobacteria bacterium]